MSQQVKARAGSRIKMKHDQEEGYAYRAQVKSARVTRWFGSCDCSIQIVVSIALNLLLFLNSCGKHPVK